jgi:hypothetical protein
VSARWGDGTVRVTIVPAGRCPNGILWAPHFRADGSCLCEATVEERLTYSGPVRVVKRPESEQSR